MFFMKNITISPSGSAGQKQFNSDVSHELRTPLSVILSQSEYALEETSSDAERTQAPKVPLSRSHLQRRSQNSMI